MIRKIISGGQTGVDLAAIDSALAFGLDWGGFVPKGRRNESGVIPPQYDKFVEIDTTQYAERTRANVLASDGTLIIVSSRRLGGGTEHTYQQSLAHKKPVYVCVYPLDDDERVERLRLWIQNHQIAVLNVAGPRQSEDLSAAAETLAILNRLKAHGCFG